MSSPSRPAFPGRASSASLVLVALAAGFSVTASSSPPTPTPTLQTTPPQAEWLACSSDADCSATSLSCHGWVPIAREHEQDLQRWYSAANSEFLSVVECDGPDGPPPTAACESGRCGLHAPAKVPVRVGGLPDIDACAAVGAVARLSPGGFLAVRAGPGTTYAQLDTFANGREFFMCSVSADGQWHGIVYGDDPDANCGVASPIAEEQDYSGPCKSGWVHDRWVLLIAG